MKGTGTGAGAGPAPAADEATAAQRARQYLAHLERIVREAADDEELLGRMQELPGAVHGSLRLLALGMPAAFQPERSGGETGTIVFVVEAGPDVVEIGIELLPGGCRTIGVPAAPTTVIRLSALVFLKIAFKHVQGHDAYLDGLVDVTGDVVLAAALDDWFGRADTSLVDRVMELGLADGEHAWLAG